MKDIHIPIIMPWLGEANFYLLGVSLCGQQGFFRCFISLVSVLLLMK